MNKTCILLITAAALAASACQPKGVTLVPPSTSTQSATAPAACGANFAQRHPTYALPATKPSTDDAADKGKSRPMQWAVVHPVARNVESMSSWRDLGNGWSSLGLRLISDNATSLAVNLTGVSLAGAAEIWLCSPDGSARRGPLKAAPDGVLQTPVIPGAEAWLEVIVPTWSVKTATVTLAKVYGGFR